MIEPVTERMSEGPIERSIECMKKKVGSSDQVSGHSHDIPVDQHPPII